jgi:predicted amidohydrolase
MRDLRLVIHQMSPLLGESEANARTMGRRIEASRSADLLVFPELCLTGYSLRSRATRFAWRGEPDRPVELPRGSPPVALTVPELGRNQLVYNTALLLHGDRILARHRKVYLPTYGPFEEGRFFAAGRRLPPVVELPCGWKVGLLVCEDFWHPSLVYLLAMQGADLVLGLSAAPGRGDPGTGPDAPGPLFASTRSWLLLARAASLQYGLFVAVANRTGVEGGLTFAGGSLVTGPDGEPVAEAPQGEEAALEVELPADALRRARTPFAHLRDEDPEFLRRALAILASGELE